MSNSNERKKQRIQKNIESTEQLLNQWEEKKRNSENPNETNRCKMEISKLEKIVDDYENELTELSNQNSQNSNSEQSKNLHPVIGKALKYLENANYAGYFEEMDKVVSVSHNTTYSELKGKFIAGNTPYNFHQLLSTFAREVNKNL
jgi:predicted DNA-binding protein YlxM (UPF0122 family)